MTEIEKLSREIRDLSAWIGEREAALNDDLARHSERVHTLLRLGHGEEEVEAEHRKLEGLKKELDGLNESRQVLELKKALLRKLQGSARAEKSR